MNLPNLVIPGAQKGATSTLVELLKTHPDIHIGELKEPHFFSKEPIAFFGEQARTTRTEMRHQSGRQHRSGGM